MYHQIKSLREKYSLQACARLLGVSVNTIRKYEKMDFEEASSYFESSIRKSQYDVAREFIEGYLSDYPNIKATKLLRKVKERYPQISGKARGFRKYLSRIKVVGNAPEFRNYAPVLDMVPGQQVQVDIGEARVERDASGKTFKAYFVSFVFSYSRHSYVSFRSSYYDTDSFIAVHEEAFAYFGGVALEFVYDQTKLVVVCERYREVFFNDRFHQFALKANFKIRVCEGYDPESKGKVERFISYVKSDFLYGDRFENIAAVRRESAVWLSEVANVRIHASTQQRPIDLFEEEARLLKPYPHVKHERRFADKTGLISYKGNKYSVPHTAQRSEVGVREEATYLLIHDLHQGCEIARHLLGKGKGKIYKNNNHYRDYRKRIEEIRADALAAFNGADYARTLVERLASENPQIARDQLRGLIKLRKEFSEELWDAAAPCILQLPHLKATLIESVLQSYRQRERLKQIDAQNDGQTGAKSSVLDRSMKTYAEAANHAG
jgi:transposase